MISCINESKPLALPWGRTPRLDSDVRVRHHVVRSYSNFSSHCPPLNPNPFADLSGITRASSCYFLHLLCQGFPLAVLWHNNKTLRKDPHPTPDEFDANVCDYLADNLALLRKLPEPFLCFMDLFAFINHADPTKVQIGEREVGDREVPLLQLTRSRVVPLAGVNDQGNANVQGVGNDNVNEEGGDVAVADQTDKKEEEGCLDCLCSGHPPKKLREDHGASRDVGARTARKSLAALQGPLDSSTLAVELSSEFLEHTEVSNAEADDELTRATEARFMGLQLLELLRSNLTTLGEAFFRARVQVQDLEETIRHKPNKVEAVKTSMIATSEEHEHQENQDNQNEIFEEKDDVKPPISADTFGSNAGNDSETSGPKTPTKEVVENNNGFALTFLVGYGSPRALQLWKKIVIEDVLMLLDSGGAHNFAQPNRGTEIEVVVGFLEEFQDGDMLDALSRVVEQNSSGNWKELDNESKDMKVEEMLNWKEEPTILWSTFVSRSRGYNNLGPQNQDFFRQHFEGKVVLKE
ncbi:hypothetical protein Tco_0474691 [Tanacetum coccineum]